jgi:hypothetical protein
MTRPFHRRNRLEWLTAALLITLGLTGFAQANDTQPEKDTMAQTSMTLWQAIDALAQQIPFSKEKVEKVLSTQLFERASANEYFHFYKSPSISLAEGVVIFEIDLRIKKEGGHPGFLGAEIIGTCITLDQIRARYDQLKVVGHPRGKSLDEKTVYSQVMPWGNLSFGFRERNPDCLASVGFGPKKDD